MIRKVFPKQVPPLRTCAAIQQEIVDSFQQLGGDASLMLDHLIALGEQLPVLPAAEHKASYLVAGCMAQVWLLADAYQGHLYLRGDSDASITKGLVSLLLQVFSEQSITTILATEPFFLATSGLEQLLGGQRRSGFQHMVAKIKSYAQAHTTL